MAEIEGIYYGHKFLFTGLNSEIALGKNNFFIISLSLSFLSHSTC